MVKKIENQRQKNSGNRGQSLIELALMLPFLLVLIITAIEVGRLFFTKIVVTNAAREGAYYLSMHPEDYNSTTGAAPYTVLAAEQEAGNSGIPNITVTISTTTAGAGEEGGEDEGGEDDGGWGWWGWGGGGWGWGGGCVCQEDEEEIPELLSVRVTVQTDVPDVLFLNFLGNVFSIGATNHDVFPVSSCVEMLVP